VPAFIGGVTSAGLRELEAAIDDDPVGLGKTLGQRIGVY